MLAGVAMDFRSDRLASNTLLLHRWRLRKG
jgi:hypothetical protein